MNVSLYQGDCLNVLAGMPDNSVDSIVTDPPYGISFMNKKWDYDVPSVAIWTECLRVLKPGGHILAFASARTQHKMATNIEDAGFEIRDMVTYLYDTSEVAKTLLESLSPDQRKLLDATFGRDAMLAWVYGSGFPKSHNLKDGWEGWGSALKPALEPITMARKPFKGTLSSNVQTHGTGALNIDGCRVEWPDGKVPEVGTPGWGGPAKKLTAVPGQEGETVDRSQPSELGRWPANLILDGTDEVTGLFPHSTSGAMKADTKRAAQNEAGSVCYGKFGGNFASDEVKASSGSASRFFYCAKATRKDRNEGMEDPGPQFRHGATLRNIENTTTRGNNHPTVKPTELMRWLCRLVTPPGGVVLDPFMGSGSTGKAALIEGFGFIGIELDEGSYQIAEARVSAAYVAPAGHVVKFERSLSMTLGAL